MEGHFSDRVKKLFQDPEKARMLMDYLYHPKAAEKYILTVTDTVIDIRLNPNYRPEDVEEAVPVHGE
jgi:hypothetical protein